MDRFNKISIRKVLKSPYTNIFGSWNSEALVYYWYHYLMILFGDGPLLETTNVLLIAWTTVRCFLRSVVGVHCTVFVCNGC